jgi:hypothetical protein
MKISLCGSRLQVVQPLPDHLCHALSITPDQFAMDVAFVLKFCIVKMNFHDQKNISLTITRAMNTIYLTPGVNMSITQQPTAVKRFRGFSANRLSGDVNMKPPHQVLPIASFSNRATLRLLTNCIFNSASAKRYFSLIIF